MATITAGQSITLQLGADDAYKLTTTGTSEARARITYIEFGTPKQYPIVQNDSETYGPYGCAATLVIDCYAGSADYGQFSEPEPVLATKSVTGVLEKLRTGTSAQMIYDAPVVVAKERRNSRMTRGGKCVFRFDDHTVLTKSGTNAANVTLSTVSGAAGIAYDSSGSRTGSPKMVKIVGTAAATGDVLIEIPSANFPDVATGGKVGVWLYISPDGSWPGSMAEYLFDKTSGVELVVNLYSVGIKLGWNFLVFNQASFAHPTGVSIAYNIGGVDLVANTLKYMRLSFATMANATVYLDSVWTDFTQKPSICLGFDTVDADIISIALPALSSRGMVGYIAEPCQVGGAYFSDLGETGPRIDRMRTVYDAGWDVVNHSTTHLGLGGQDADVIRYQLEFARAWALAHGFVRGSEFYVSPESSTSWLSETTIKALGFVAQRHAKHVNMHLTPFGYDNLNAVGSMDCGNKSASQIIAQINAAEGYGADLHLFAHNLVAGGPAGGDAATGNALTMYDTTLYAVLDHLKAREAAGAIEIARGMTGWYYGQ